MLGFSQNDFIAIHPYYNASVYAFLSLLFPFLLNFDPLFCSLLFFYNVALYLVLPISKSTLSDSSPNALIFGVRHAAVSPSVPFFHHYQRLPTLRFDRLIHNKRRRNPMYPQEWTRALAVQKALDAYSGGKTLLPNGGNISPRTNRGTISAINAVQNRYQKALTEITDKKLLAAITTAEKDRAAAQAKTKKAKADYDKAEKYMEDTYKSKEKRLKERDEALRKAEEAKKKAKEPKHEMVLWRERVSPFLVFHFVFFSCCLILQFLSTGLQILDYSWGHC